LTTDDHGVTRKVKRNGFDFYKIIIRAGLTGLSEFFVDHFPEENGQTQSPSANSTRSANFLDIKIHRLAIEPVMVFVFFRRRRIKFS